MLHNPVRIFMKHAWLLASFIAIIAVTAQAQIMDPRDIPPQPYMPPQQQVMAAPPPVYCQPYSDSFTMGHETRITRGTACIHPDGSWELHPAQIGANYVMRGGSMYLLPVQPFAVVVTGKGHHRHWHE
jgi:hypothetical protein